MTTHLRVAASQFATTTDVEQNLTTTQRAIEAAARERAHLVVLPEFCNHLSIYDDAEHAWEVAVELDDEWFATVGGLAARHTMWIQLNVTLRRDRTTRRITNTNVVFDPSGRVRALNDKTVLMGAEGDYLSCADEPSKLIQTEFGRIGTYACMDGVVPEVPRSVAARGATLMLNSLNSFALDEASLHIPIRAAENRCFVVACCKVGPLLPPDKQRVFSEAMGVPVDALTGAGESQIVGPEGTVLAKAPAHGEAVVVAEIDPTLPSRLRRPDGTDMWAARRPVLYAPLCAPTPPIDTHPRREVVIAATATSVDAALDVVGGGASLVVLPELTLDDDRIATLVSALQEPSNGVPAACIVATMRELDAHIGVAITADGIVGRQPQLHTTQRHAWATDLGDRVVTIDLDWGRLGIIVGDDGIYPEVARMLALDSVDVIALPANSQQPWETELCVVERSAENRVITVLSNPIDNPFGSVICDLPADFTLWAPSRERAFDGTINQPMVTVSSHPEDVSLVVEVHPLRTVNRQISRGTDLVNGRPWQICGPLAMGEVPPAQ